MKIENLNRLYHPEFRVSAQPGFDCVDIYLLPRSGGVCETQLSNALIKNTPEDGVLALLERYWQIEKHHKPKSELHDAAPDLLAALELLMDAPLCMNALRTACLAVQKAKGGSA